MNSVAFNTLGNQKPSNFVSDDSEDDDVLLTEECWDIPDEGWTLVGNPRTKARGVQLEPKPPRLVNREARNYEGTRCNTLDDYEDNSVLTQFQRKLMKNTVQKEEVPMNVKTLPVTDEVLMTKQPDRLLKTRVNREKMSVTGCPKSLGRKTEQRLDKPTNTRTVLVDGNLAVKDEQDRVMVHNVPAKEAHVIDCPTSCALKNKATPMIVSLELVDLPQTRITGGFLELAKEASLMDVDQTMPGCMDDNDLNTSELCDSTDMDILWRTHNTEDLMIVELRSIDMSSRRTENIDRPVENCTNEAMRMQLDGIMIDHCSLELNMISRGPVWREAEPVSVAAESEMFTQVCSGEVVAHTDPLVLTEAITSRVSALSVVGNDFHTSLSRVVDRADRFSMNWGHILDKVGHGAGQLRTCTVPVEDWNLFSVICLMMPFLMRAVTVQTATFFLADEIEEVPDLLVLREDRLVRIQKLYSQEAEMCATMTKAIHGVGPNGDRWDGIDVFAAWFVGWVRTTNRELEYEPAARTGSPDDFADWPSGYPNRRAGWTVVIIRGLRLNWPFRQQLVWWQCTRVCDCGFISVKYCMTMSTVGFLKSISAAQDERLYDLPPGIQDVIGLQALRPSAAVCKVMSTPESNSVRVITPDEHVPTGFHEILIEDMGLAEWHKVPMTDIGCLRLDWPPELFTFVGRYQVELELMRKECRDQFEGTTSGKCTTCDKFIQNSLGRHVAMYHLDLAQLWRCPVGWCPVWKGTSQDCVDHMRRAHNTPILMKAGNLARWFPPWTVTRKQWHNMSRPSVSGIAIDTFLFSRIGMPLFHCYRVFDRFGSHPVFRTPYMTNLFLFLKESDSEAIRRSHRRRAKELAVGLSQTTPVPRSVVSETIRSGPAPQRTVVSRKKGANTDSLLVTSTGDVSRPSGLVRKNDVREEDTVRALMDLSLPRFTRLEDGRLPKVRSWPGTDQPPSSPATSRDGGGHRTPSPILQLDGLTTACSAGGPVRSDYRLTMSTDSSTPPTPMGSMLSNSDDDVPLRTDQNDRRKVQRRELNEDHPGPIEAPHQVPDVTPVPVDRVSSVSISEAGQLSPEGVTQNRK